jgi:hypothetical protein
MCLRAVLRYDSNISEDRAASISNLNTVYAQAYTSLTYLKIWTVDSQSKWHTRVYPKVSGLSW